MANTKKSNSELRESIFKKLGYTVEYQDLEIDEETGDEIESNEEGFYWQDSCGNPSEEFFESEDEAIFDLLAGVDLETECSGVKLTKAEKIFLSKEYNAEL